MRGKFMVFEGIDGSGKSTQVKLLAEHLKSLGQPVHVTCEPTKRTIGTIIRQVLTGQLDMDQQAIAALFLADRMDHLNNPEDGIVKLLNQGTHVICDRYYFSSYAYHSVYVPMDWVIDMNSACADILRPDVNFYLDITAEDSSHRIHQSRDQVELYENIDTLRAVRKNYLTAFDQMKEVEKIVTLNAMDPVEKIAGEIVEMVNGMMG